MSLNIDHLNIETLIQVTLIAYPFYKINAFIQFVILLIL